MGAPEHRYDCRRESTEVGPDFCATCSEQVGDWVQWEGHTYREASLIRQLAPRLLTMSEVMRRGARPA